MQGERKQRWMVLAEQAAVEQDPVKMLEVITEINRLLRDKGEGRAISKAAGCG